MSDLWPKNSLTKLFHIDFPLIQGPLSGQSTTELITSISYAGGLGVLEAFYMRSDQIRKAISSIRMKTSKRFHVHLYCVQKQENAINGLEVQKALNPYRKKLGLAPINTIANSTIFFEEQLEVILEERVPVFSFSCGILTNQQMEALKKNNTKVIGTATNLDEVKALDAIGVDAIVLQGAEAGGHRSTFIGSLQDSLMSLLSLIPIAKETTQTPLIASGGITCGGQIAAALLLGAQGVQMGTAFLACPESGISACYKNALSKLSTLPTVITSAYSGRAARVIHTPFLDELETLPITSFPDQYQIMQDLRDKCSLLAKTDFIPLFAGESFSQISKRPALEIFYELVQSTSQHLKDLQSK